MKTQRKTIGMLAAAVVAFVVLLSSTTPLVFAANFSPPQSTGVPQTVYTPPLEAQIAPLPPSNQTSRETQAVTFGNVNISTPPVGSIGGVIGGSVVVGSPLATGAGTLTEVSFSDLLWSQTSAGGVEGEKALRYRELLKNGWGTLDPPEAVLTPDGITLFDNTRAAVALDMGYEKIPVRVYLPTDAIPLEYAERIGFKGFKTWGEVLENRLIGQKAVYVLPYGTAKPPILMDTLERAGSQVGVLDDAAALNAGKNVGALDDALMSADSLLARKLAPVIDKVSDWTGKITSPLESVAAAIAAKFPAAAAYGAKLAEALAPFAKLAGGALAGLGIIFGFLQVTKSGPEFLRILEEEGLGALGTREGWVALLDTLSGGLDMLAGAAAIAALASSATVVGGLGFGALSLLLAGGSLLLKGTSWAIENWDMITQKAGEMWESMKSGAAAAWQLAQDAGKSVVDFGVQMKDYLVSGFDAVVEAVAGAGKKVVEVVEQVVAVVVQVPVKIIEKVKVLVPKVTTVLKEVARDVIKIGTRMVEKVVDVARDVTESVVRSGTHMVEKVIDVVKQVARTVYDTVRNIVDQGANVVKQVARTVYDTVRNIVDQGSYVTKQVASTVYDTVTTWVDQSFTEKVRSIWGWFTRTITKAVAVVKQVARTVYTAVTTWVPKMVEVVKQVPRTVYDAVVEWVPQYVQEAYTYVEQIPRTIVEKVKMLVPEEYTYTERVVDYVPEEVTEYIEEERDVERIVMQNVPVENK